jgi:hypothetical protein
MSSLNLFNGASILGASSSFGLCWRVTDDDDAMSTRR